MYKILKKIYKSKVFTKKVDGMEVPVDLYDLDERLIALFLKKFLLAFVALIACIVFAIITRLLGFFVIGIAIAFYIFIDNTIKIENCLNDRVIEVRGIYHKKDAGDFGDNLKNFFQFTARSATSGTKLLYIKNIEEGGLDAIVSVPARFDVEDGNEVTFFAPTSALFFKNENIVQVNSTYYIEVTRL